MTEHHDLIEALRRRESGAVDELLRRHGPLMRYIIAPILSDEREREECLSDAAMTAWDKIGQYDPDKGSWLSWLSALTRNLALNRARKGRRAAEEQELGEHLTDGENHPEESLLRAERAAALRKALARLSGGERALLYRKYYYMQSTAQIAAELGMTERAVEGRLYRLKKGLREQLGGDGFAGV